MTPTADSQLTATARHYWLFVSGWLAIVWLVFSQQELSAIGIEAFWLHAMGLSLLGFLSLALSLRYFGLLNPSRIEPASWLLVFENWLLASSLLAGWIHLVLAISYRFERGWDSWQFLNLSARLGYGLGALTLLVVTMVAVNGLAQARRQLMSLGLIGLLHLAVLGGAGHALLIGPDFQNRSWLIGGFLAWQAALLAAGMYLLVIKLLAVRFMSPAKQLIISLLALTAAMWLALYILNSRNDPNSHLHSRVDRPGRLVVDDRQSECDCPPVQRNG